MHNQAAFVLSDVMTLDDYVSLSVRDAVLLHKVVEVSKIHLRLSLFQLLLFPVYLSIEPLGGYLKN